MMQVKCINDKAWCFAIGDYSENYLLQYLEKGKIYQVESMKHIDGVQHYNIRNKHGYLISYYPTRFKIYHPKIKIL